MTGGQESEKPLFSLSILSYVSATQLQNGLRHGDYQRYRQYLTRRLRRLRKSIKFTYGKGKQFTFRKVSSDNAENERFLLVPLLNAERAWAYAMQLQQDAANNQDNSRIKFHLLRRLSKAAAWSKELQSLCSQLADGRSSLEAEAYTAYMTALFALEKEEWQAAYDGFVTARRIYEELGKVGSLAEQDLFQSRVEKMNPNIRYCKYNIDLLGKMRGDKNQSSRSQLRSIRDDNLDDTLLQAKLDAVLGEERKRQAEEMVSINWRGQDLPVPTKEVGMALIRVDELSSRLLENRQSSARSGATDSLYLEIFSAYDEAHKLVLAEKEKLKSITAGAKTLQQQQQLDLLESYIKFKKISKLIERHELTVEDLERKLGTQDDEKAASATSSGPQIRPEDMIHIFDVLLKSVTDLQALPTAADYHETAKLQALEHKFQSYRSYHIAEAYAKAGKWAEASVVYDHAASLAAAAEEEYREVIAGETLDTSPLEEQVEKLSQLGLKALAGKARAHGHGFLLAAKIEQEMAEGVNDMTVQVHKRRKVQSLLDRLQDYDSGEKLKHFGLVEVPPPLQPMACKPLLFDIAYNSIVLPDISRRTKTKEQQEMAKQKQGWFGWLRG